MNKSPGGSAISNIEGAFCTWDSCNPRVCATESRFVLVKIESQPKPIAAQFANISDKEGGITSENVFYGTRALRWVTCPR